MADFVFNKKAIGSAGGRDFSTNTAFIAALPNPFVNEVFFGELFADSDFVENVDQDAPNAVDNLLLTMAAASGERPIVKSSSGSFVWTTGQDCNFAGIILDGTNLTGAGAIAAPGNRCIMTGIIARNHPSGSGFNSDGSGRNYAALFCLAHGNNLDGFNNGLSAPNTMLIGCGAAKNGRFGIRGRNATNKTNIGGCWSLGNGANQAIEGSSVGIEEFVYIDDASLSDIDDVFINQVIANLGFVNFAADDFRLAAGSVLLAAGFPVLHKSRIDFGSLSTQKWQYATVDAFGNDLLLPYGTRMNVGPDQPAIPPTVITNVFNQIPLTLEVTDPRISI